MKTNLWVAVAMMAMALNAPASFIYNFTVGTAIPDNNPSGLVNNQTISDVTEAYVSGITVRLNISGGWNGDLYVYLRHETAGGVGFTELLNRVGTGAGNPVGYTDAGFGPDASSNPFRLTDSASNPDVHHYQDNSPTYNSGQLTGTWRVDQTGNGSFDSFDGLDPNGTWSLFAADLSGNHVSTLEGWGLEITAVPEPTNIALGIFAVGLLAVAGVRLWRKARVAARR